MIIVFFNNQNLTTMQLSEAKELITSAPDKNTAIRTYLECWKQLYKREDKVKLEVWWHNNHSQLKFYHDSSLEGEKETFELRLSPDEQKECEAELDEMEMDLSTGSCGEQAELNYFMENN